MIPFFDSLRDINVLSVSVRMLLAVICGGVIGIEREFKRRPAGVRSHILSCVGGALTTLTSQYLYLYMHYYTDMARLGAQVVAGIGFIGAGTIIVTRQQRVKGLTTAAGLWTSAIVGLALGGGFYEGGILTTVLILLAELLFARLEYRMLENRPEINLYMECTDKACLEITRPTGSEHHNACAIFSLRLNKRCRVEKLLADIHATQGVLSVEEL